MLFLYFVQQLNLKYNKKTVHFSYTKQREISFEKFLKQETRILVATDVASRGLDLIHVFK